MMRKQISEKEQKGSIHGRARSPIVLKRKSPTPHVPVDPFAVKVHDVMS